MPLPQAPIPKFVVVSEPDYYASAQVAVPPSDPYYAEQWALPVIGALTFPTLPPPVEPTRPSAAPDWAGAPRPAANWTAVTVDLAAYRGQTGYLQFVWLALPLAGQAADTWQVDEISVVDAPLPTIEPTPTVTASELAAEATSAPTDVPTEAPTDMPTDMPTDLPTDVPTDLPDCTYFIRQRVVIQSFPLNLVAGDKNLRYIPRVLRFEFELSFCRNLLGYYSLATTPVILSRLVCQSS